MPQYSSTGKLIVDGQRLIKDVKIVIAKLVSHAVARHEPASIRPWTTEYTFSRISKYCPEIRLFILNMNIHYPSLTYPIIDNTCT